MQDRVYNIRISPEVIKNKIFPKSYIDGGFSTPVTKDPCCDNEPNPIAGQTTGITFVYSSMTEILSGGENGESLLNSLTIPPEK